MLVGGGKKVGQHEMMMRIWANMMSLMHAIPLGSDEDESQSSSSFQLFPVNFLQRTHTHFDSQFLFKALVWKYALKAKGIPMEKA